MCFDGLKMLGTQFEAAIDAIAQFEANGVADDARMNALLVAQDEVAEKIIAAPALTREHLAIKARVVQAVGFGELNDGIEMRAIKSLIVATADLNDEGRC